MAAEGTDKISLAGLNVSECPDLSQPDVGVVSVDNSGSDRTDTVATCLMPALKGEEENGSELPADFNRMWNLVSDHPQDFNSWTELLQYCKEKGNLTASRRALTAFLARYPLCYGYWKRFADLERQAGSNDKAEETCIQGLKVIPLSIDLWIHYINLLLGTLNMNLPESIQRIRSTFEEAVATAGWEWNSDRLWDLYGEWEKEQGDLRAMTAVYDHVLRVPTHLYNTHYEKLKAHLTSHTLQEVLCAEEYTDLWNKYNETRAKKEKTESAITEDQKRSPGDDESADQDKDSVISLQKEFVEKMRELVLASREKVYKQNEVEVKKRWNYEDAIKRPYFHVKSLDCAQLNAWENYLDWEIAEAGVTLMPTEEETVERQESSEIRESVAGHKRVQILFERCLIACALYEQFWDKYVHYLEPHSLEETRSVYQRACEIHLPYKHSLHIQWAMYEEKQGNISEAKRILETLEKSIPGLAVIRLRRVALERRTGCLDEAESLLKDALVENKHKPHLHAFFSIKLARFLFKLGKNLARARAILQEAIELSPDNSKLYLNLLELELSGDQQCNGGGVHQCISKALAAPLSSEAKILFSKRRLQFAEDFGTTVQSLSSIDEEHQKLSRDLGVQKRAAGDRESLEPEKIRKIDYGFAATATLPLQTPAMPPATTMDMMGYGNYGSWHQQQYGGYGNYNSWNQYSQY